MYGIVRILALLPAACIDYILEYVDITLLLHRSKFALCNASTFLTTIKADFFCTLWHLSILSKSFQHRLITLSHDACKFLYIINTEVIASCL